MTNPIPPASPSDQLPPLAGLVLLDKPARRPITSMVAVHEVRRRLVRGGLGPWKKLKVGHAGTLDPLASGLLVILVGKATRLCEPLMAKTKVYLATIDLSRRSPTEDLEQPTTPNEISTPPTLVHVQVALATFVGDIQQRPPDHSAIMIDGQRAYDIARRGHDPKIQPRTIRIDEMSLISYDFPLLTFEVRCGKGTYIRSLARDIGEALTGQPATLTALRRTYSAPFRVEDATPMDSLPDAITREQLLPVPELVEPSSTRLQAP
jgi:tRNA pseudouridine55 synthase